ncbi:uncharacterized protein LACBIDRAFT_331563 [Laccaria bicolor S238N-H82]|uniref:Predicted protein n=1 Tax=Laccaria bicolor (strain S238N-H82 / ATCC MYA-4686) TaxID=486041 RepID=B0DPU8_LACBS|nr:uncharacterized protein LACBIDRAFT_331563 [Laccaria bicolor S238N-H82]EDR03519.1 predicted protein [Laccaria bicolor S238N-H82]|eukprot:XP_001885975.1 predicted protein [Laccaria bicolor S238N-H82]
MASIVEPALRDKLALITGCTGGIGWASALSLARLGCSIAVHYNSAAEKATELISQLQALPGIKAAAFKADLSDYDNVRRLHREVVATLGHPDILFNNSGSTGRMIGPLGDIESITVDEFEEIWRLNTGSSFLALMVVVDATMPPQHGRQYEFYQNFNNEIFNDVLPPISVAAGTGGVVGPHYASSKSALHGLLHWIAMRYAKDGISRIPIARFGVPDEVASIVVLLVTNSYMTNKVYWEEIYKFKSDYIGVTKKRISSQILDRKTLNPREMRP